jgi:hypothetical protein
MQIQLIVRKKDSYLEFRLINNIASLDEDNYENLNDVGFLYGKSIGKVVQFTILGGLE